MRQVHFDQVLREEVNRQSWKKFIECGEQEWDRGSIKDTLIIACPDFRPPFWGKSIQIFLGDSPPVHAVWEELTLFLTPELGQSEHCIPGHIGWFRDGNVTPNTQRHRGPIPGLWLAPSRVSSLSAEIAGRPGGGLGLWAAILPHQGMRSLGEDRERGGESESNF